MILDNLGVAGLRNSEFSAALAFRVWPLFGKLLSTFFSLNENIVGITEFLFPRLSDFAEAVPVIKLKLVQVFEKVLIDFGL